ncbi:MAG TPA: tRNA (guanosine(37)-N1)-methyltransferase TrmD [Eubacteriaceae bacterium]|jgi:tRNA (guanine37-N1)-methyltransferase|nr:tRNA (guanosine(37)-N1)-methyltransferase TrmD [Eubacteriaceae bacterium]
MKIDILTLFPELFRDFLNTSILKRAIDKDLININIINIRDYSKDKHKKVDDYTYGGGPGMVLTPQPIYDAYKCIDTKDIDTPCIYLSPQGKTFNQDMAMEFSQYPHLIFLCGHYEGIDQRIIDKIVTHEVSIGDYILTGGELPTMVVIDAISRLVPGVLGNENSSNYDSFSDGLLEYPHYTRPYEFMGEKVPDILLSGDHEKIRRWRKGASLINTKKKRPDLLKKYNLTEEEKEILRNYNESDLK